MISPETVQCIRPRAHEAHVVGHQRAREARRRSGHDEPRQLVAIHGEPQGQHPFLVLLAALQHHAEAGTHQPPADHQEGRQDQEADVVEGRLVFEIENREPVPLGDAQSVVAAVHLQGDEEVVEHLRECQRDHDEVHPAGAQADGAHQQGEQRRARHRQRPHGQGALQAGQGKRPGRSVAAGRVKRKDADDIGARAEVGRVAEAHHAAEAEDEVEAHRGQGEDEDPGEKPDEK